MAPCCLPFKITNLSQTKLRNICQRAIGDNDCVKRMAPLPPDRQRVQDLDGPPKPLLLPKSPETKSTTSMMGDGIGRIQLHNAP